MEITQQTIIKLLKEQSKLDREYLDKTLDAKLDVKLAQQTFELKQYVHEAFEVQQVYIDERFKELVQGLRFQAILPGLKRR